MALFRTFTVDNIDAKGYSNWYKMKVEVHLNSQSIANNTSNITLKQFFATKTKSAGFYQNNNAYLKTSLSVDGGSYTERINSKIPEMPQNSANVWRAFSTWTGNVSHKSDGTLNIRVKVAFTYTGSSTSSYLPKNTTGTSGDIALTTIPRASSISSFPNFTIGNSFKVTISRASTAFTHTLSLYVGSTLVATKTGVGTSSTFTLSTTEQNKIYAAIPSKTSVTMTMRCYTYNGSTSIGSYKTKTATASVSSSIVPSFTTITHAEYVASVKDAIGSYVQTRSRLSLAITGASGAKYSTISSYKITFDGSTFNSRTATSGYIKGSGSLAITGTVTDSRGRSASKTVYASVLAYAPPKITSFSVLRCDSGGNADTEGEYLKVSRAGTWSDLSSKNPITITIKTKPRTSSTYETKDTTDDSASGFAGEFILSPYTIIQSFDIRIEAKDLFNTTVSEKPIPTGKVTMSWGKAGIGVGKVWEQGALDVGGNIHVAGGIINKSGFPLLTSSGTLGFSSRLNADASYSFIVPGRSVVLVWCNQGGAHTHRKTLWVVFCSSTSSTDYSKVIKIADGGTASSTIATEVAGDGIKITFTSSSSAGANYFGYLPLNTTG